MGIYSKGKNVIGLMKQKGFKKTVCFYLNRKKEQEKALHTIQRYHLPPGEELQEQRNYEWSNMPLISIITPLYNTPKEFLEQLIDSVLKQTYVNWELCLADGSDEKHDYIGELCRSYARRNYRIIYKKLENNEGIVGNTNHCIGMASGDYYGLLDHDDLLHPSSLFEVVKAINEGADFIYTDEMKFQGDVENSTDIVCKNGFGKDELRSHNYICHFVVFQKRLLEGMNEFYRQKCEGSQDYDMVLRLTEKASKIVHIPKILYYWRVHQGSVSMDLSVKQYAVDSAKKAIADQLNRSDEKGSVECNFPYQTIYKVSYELRTTPLISVYLWGDLEGAELLLYMKEILSKTHYKMIEFLVPKNVSETKIGNVPVIVVEAKNQNLYEWFNQAEEFSRGEYNLYFCEACTPMEPMWIEELLMFVQREDVGVVGAHILYRKNQTYFAGAVLDKEAQAGIHVIDFNVQESEQGYEANLKHVRNTTILSILCMLVSKKEVAAIGGFRTSMGACADADLCLRCRQTGKWNVWTCFSRIYYNGNESVYRRWEKCQEFLNGWDTELRKGDEYYHPLLKALGRI